MEPFSKNYRLEWQFFSKSKSKKIVLLTAYFSKSKKRKKAG